MRVVVAAAGAALALSACPSPGATPAPSSAVAAASSSIAPTASAAPLSSGAAATPAPSTDAQPTLEDAMSPEAMQSEPLGKGGGGPGAFDKQAVVSAFKAVSYKGCGKGGAGKIKVVFAGATGRPTSVSVIAGNYTTGTKGCIEARFRSMKIPPFDVETQAVSFPLKLEE